MKKVLMLMLPLIMTVACTAQKTPDDVNAAQAEEMMKNEEVVVLDVRTPDEWNKGHLEGATHINFYDDNFEQEVAKLPKDKEYVVYCHSGGRSAKAVQMMKESGFEQVHNLQGGIIAWEKEGNEVVK